MLANLTNEGGFGNKIRLLRNVMGLWMVQECKREWDAAGDTVGFDDLVHRAGSECRRLYRSLIPMPRCSTHPDRWNSVSGNSAGPRDRQVPEGQGAVVRCAYESLALKYRWAVEHLEAVTAFTRR